MIISIIIAVKTWQKNLEECVSKCLQLDYPAFEIIILPDESFSLPVSLPVPLPIPVFIVPTGPVNPAAKRDMALKHAKGEILAFLDDDAYPLRDWLSRAADNFRSEEIAAVGGPAVTPDSDSARQKASGLVYSSFLVSGPYAYRYLPKKRKEVDDFPSCNLFVRRSVFEQVGGFNTQFWPGEDTKLCLDITCKLRKKIIYDPEVIVYHHRRRLFLPHLKQVANYALHRGYFAKRFPRTSLRISYFLPSILFLGIVAGGIFSLFSSGLRSFYLYGLTLYVLTVLVSSIYAGFRFSHLVFSGIIVTHLAYGLYFLKGLFANKLKEEQNG